MVDTSIVIGALFPLAILMMWIPVLKWLVERHLHWVEVFVAVCGFIMIVLTVFFIVGEV